MRSPRGYLPFITVFLLAAACARAQVTIQIGQNFTGSTYGADTAAIPADANGAIGPGYFMEFINGNVALYDKTNGDRTQQPVSDVTFWADANVTLASGAAVTDPRVIYDSSVQRWFATQVDLDGTAVDPISKANNFLLAVSDTSDPSGSWHGFRFKADPTHGDFADFPTLGVDSNAVYISGDMFRVVSGVDTPMGAGLVSIPKADLLTATPTVANRTYYGVMDYSVRGQVLQPVVCTDGSSHGNIVATGNIGMDSIPYSNLVCFAVLNGGGPGATLSAATNVNVAPYLVPYNSDLDMPWFTATQPDGTSYMSGNDARLSSLVYGVSGVLYAVHSTYVNNHIAVRWYRINATNYTLLESGTISDPTLDLFFPAIAANANGTVVIICNGSGPGIDQNLSCYAYGGQTVNGTTTFGNHILLQSGALSYHGDDEFLAELLDEPLSSRWGDYSALSVDPANPTHFWSIQMFPSDEANEDVWSTQITELIVTPPRPVLDIARSGTNEVLSWPASFTGFQLKVATNLTPTVTWTDAPQAPSTNAGRISVTVPITNGARYFRLQK